MKKILVSRCLYGGAPVRYDGKIKEETDPRFLRWKQEGRLIPVCPEVDGGLPVPRPDAQRKGDKIIARTGADVTAQYRLGAEKALEQAKAHQVLCAILKEQSPSCGSSRIYDGSFQGEKIPGAGLTTELLRREGISVFSEEQLDQVEELLRKADEADGSVQQTDLGDPGSRQKQNIVLIGMPACGKSVTGVVLAKTLKMKFIDADLLIQERMGKSLQEIIDQDGIEVFKEVEEATLCSIHVENAVIATGGSAVYYPAAMERLKENGIVVYLQAPLRAIKKRLRNIKTRGVAMKKGQTLDDLYRIRTPLYERYADRTVKAGSGTVEQAVQAIMDVL